MSTVTLRDLYAAELHDLMNAEKQLAAELPIMAGRATSARLQRALEEHHAETKIQIERLRLLLEQLNEPPRAVPSGAVAALIEDARRRLDDAERGETLDAALIAAAQRIEHWEMATYGTARSYAEALGDYDAVRILQQTLDEEGHADHVLTKLAERGINQAAGDDLLEESTRYRSRLRFVGAKDVPEAREHDIHLHNRAGEHLGTLDGFIVDSQSGRPIYYVIDSRGWFAGRRYVVPVGQIEAEESASALRTSLTRAELARYPEFSPSAFTAMDDHDAIAAEILTRAGAELASAAASVIGRLAMRGDAFPTVLAGGIFRGIPWLVDDVTRRLSEIAPRTQVQRLEVEPAIGAVRLALAAARGSFAIPTYV